MTRNGTTHAADYWHNVSATGLVDRDRPWVGNTRCGKTVFGEAAGGCIVPFISCLVCKKALRKDGWLV